MKNKNEKLKALNKIFNTSYFAGELLKKYSKNLKTLKVDHKKAQGLVSKADISSEELIIKSIKKSFPDHEILGEESSYIEFGNKKKALEKYKKLPWCWVIDPLDGTTNFLNGFDYYSVCIGLMNYGKPVLGVVYRPETSECFYAVEGLGSQKGFLKRGKIKDVKKLKVTQRKTLKDSLMVTGFSSEKGMLFKKEFKKFNNIVTKCRGVRRLGSAALDMCYVAEGVFDGFWESGLAPWDVCASSVICEQANVKVCDYEGKKFNPFQDTIMAIKKSLLKEMKTNLKD